MNVIYLQKATHDLRRLHKFLNDKNPAAAEKAILTIKSSVQGLSQSPLTGLSLSNAGTYREHYISFGKAAYVLRYRIEGDTLYVTRIWHSREDRGDSTFHD